MNRAARGTQWVRAVWSFIAGDSKLAPLGVAIAVVIAPALARYVPAAPSAGIVFVAIIALGLIAGVFERTSGSTNR